MGKVAVEARIEKLEDIFAVEEGWIAPGEVRTVDVTNALADTGATGLSMPRSLVERLGLMYRQTRTATTAAGPVAMRIFGSAQLSLLGRDCPVDVTELPDGCPVLIGQIPLEAMDFVVDPPSRRVIGNPAHGGEQIIDIY